MADLPFTLDQLRILRAIVREGSFKKAADSLYVTQPAVSLQIQNLEKQLEVLSRGGEEPQGESQREEDASSEEDPLSRFPFGLLWRAK